MLPIHSTTALVAAWLWVFQCGLASAGQLENQPQPTIELARQLIDSKQYESAVTVLKTLDANDTVPSGNISLLFGLIYLGIGKPAKAIQYFEETLFTSIEDEAEAYLGLAEAEFALGDIQKSRRDASLAYKSNPELSAAENLLTRIDQGGGRSDQNSQKPVVTGKPQPPQQAGSATPATPNILQEPQIRDGGNQLQRQVTPLTHPDPLPFAHGTMLTTGSGLVLGNTRLIITNRHVIEDASILVARNGTGHIRKARVVKVSQTDDLALIEIESPYPEACAMPISDISEPTPGRAAIVMGFPLINMLGDEQPSLTEGIVSKTTGLNNDHKTFQLTAKLNKGRLNSR